MQSFIRFGQHPRRSRALMAALLLLALPGPVAAQFGGATANAQGDGFVLPPFEDPFARGAPQPCSAVEPREREKMRCGEAAARYTARRSGGGTAAPAPASSGAEARSVAGLPPFRDPFASAGAGTPACEALEPREREKFGHPEACGGGGGSGDGGGSASITPPPVEPAPGPAPQAGGPRPLARTDIPDLYRRVLSLPGARLSAAPGAAPDGPELPAFTIYYVYEEQQAGDTTWIRVGQSAFGEIDGWLRADTAEDWRTMLVMQYASKGSRGPVLFFKRRDDLMDFATDRYVAEEVRLAYEEIESGEYQDDYFIAIEPSLGVAEDNVYLMPILDHRPEFSATGEPLRLLEVASLNTDAAAEVQTDVREVENRGVPRRAGALRRFKIGVTFVIDTTRSMQPFIEYTRGIVRSTVQALDEAGMLESFSFGLVGYRDNTAPDPRIGYVSKVFQPLDPDAAPDEVLRNFELMEQARALTSGFSEDAYAGLYTALNDLDWTPFDARLVVLITDAAPREPFDPLVSHMGYGPLNVVDDANRSRVAITALHLLTPRGFQTGNVNEAGPVYREITRTGDTGFSKYIAVDTEDPDAFVQQIRDFQAGLVESVKTLQRSRPVQKVEAETPGSTPTLGQVLVNEVFRAQLEYLGKDRDTAAPRFYRAWAADKDLQDPTLESLAVKVFLTRNQLAALNKGVESILDAYLRKDTGGGDFFAAMQAIAAETSVEGGRSGNLERAGQLLPSFLTALPYRSDFLSLDRKQWGAFGPAGQQQKIDDLRSKLLTYRSLAEERSGWIDLGAGDKGLEVFAVPLDHLP
ncbi:MAG: vWA domain-containing protein [Pseudomonadota bacterium]